MMLMRSFVYCLALCAMPAPAATLHCLAGPPGLMLSLSGETALLDYLGDGRFRLTPPLDLAPEVFGTYTLDTAGGPLPVYIRREACTIFGVDLPFAVELGIPTSEGRSPVRGCCREITQ
jgi:hypothetical protein